MDTASGNGSMVNTHSLTHSFTLLGWMWETTLTKWDSWRWEEEILVDCPQKRKKEREKESELGIRNVQRKTKLNHNSWWVNQIKLRLTIFFIVDSLEQFILSWWERERERERHTPTLDVSKNEMKFTIHLHKMVVEEKGTYIKRLYH